MVSRTLLHTVFRYGAFFPPPEPSQINAPVQVRSCGHYITENGFRDPLAKKDFLQLYWGVSGSGKFVHEKQTFYLGPRQVFFFLPGDWHDIRTETAPFEYYWLTVDGENLQELIRLFDIKRKIYDTDICPAAEFQLVEENLQNLSPWGEYLAGAAAYRIISLAMAGRISEKQVFFNFREQVQLYFSDPALSIELIARRLSVHRTTLNRTVQQCCGLSPSDYLMNYRLREAMNKLRGTKCSIKTIALETGFKDPNYFFKAFRRKFKHSPGEIRSRLQILD